jgi:serine/threonine-protein kinase
MFGASLVGETLQGHYQVTTKLGEGGFGETYLAIDKSGFDECCVVKRLKPQNQTTLRWVQQAFEQEARELKRLGKHPQIPNLFAYFQENQEFFLVQEYIEGDNLRQKFTANKQWNDNQVIFLLRDILEVLDFVHQHRVIHRDIKPANLIIQNTDKKIVLIDFGAVKQISTQVYSTQGQVISPATVVGTQGYMPVEQLQGHPMLCSDIYAVGMIAIEALTSLHPQQLNIDPNTLQVVWRNRVQVRDDVANVLDKMVSYHPSQRYQSASEALQAIHYLTKTVYKPRQPAPASTPTPQPVVKYAGFSTRLVADFLDRTILIVSSVIWDSITQVNANNAEEFLGRFIATYVILGFLYCPVMESSNFQGTLGKKLLGIVVTDLNGNRLSFEQATKRHSSKLLSYLTLFIGFFMAGWTTKKQALHDKIAQTLIRRDQ